jgi:hypothetical protein
LLWINSYIPNMNNIHAVIQVHVQMACQKCYVCVHGCCKHVNPSKSWGWFFLNHNIFSYYIYEKVKTILAGPILADQVMLICNNLRIGKDIYEDLYWEVLLKFVDTFQFWLEFKNNSSNNRHFAWRVTHITLHISSKKCLEQIL